jgi:hypothetical protein
MQQALLPTNEIKPCVKGGLLAEKKTQAAVHFTNAPVSFFSHATA